MNYLLAFVALIFAFGGLALFVYLLGKARQVCVNEGIKIGRAASQREITFLAAKLRFYSEQNIRLREAIDVSSPKELLAEEKDKEDLLAQQTSRRILH